MTCAVRLRRAAGSRHRNGTTAPMTIGKFAAVLALAAALAGCSLFPKPVPSKPGENPLAPFPDGTVDTTHGAQGAQTSPH